MTKEMYKLEASILNLQEPYERVAALYEKAKGKHLGELRQKLAEIPSLKEALLMEGSLLEQMLHSAGLLITAGDSETQERVGKVIKQFNEEHGSPMLELYEKKCKLEKKLAEYNSELSEFTVLTPVLEQPKPKHVHIYVAHSGKAYPGKIDFDNGSLSLERKECSMSELETIKATNKCPMYVATHPSRVASPPVIFCGAAKKLVEQANQEAADLMKKKIDQAMYGSMN